MQNISMFMLALHVVHGSTDGAASATPQGLAMSPHDRLILAESEGDRRREGQGKNNFEDPALRNTALGHVLEVLEHHVHKTDVKQGGGRRRQEEKEDPYATIAASWRKVNATDAEHRCTNVAYENMKFMKGYFHVEEDVQSWSMCANLCNNDRDCLSWTWSNCFGSNANEMCCNLIHRHYVVMPNVFCESSDGSCDWIDEDAEVVAGSYSGIPCAPRYVFDIPEGEDARLSSGKDRTITWEIRGNVYNYDAEVGAILGNEGPGCRAKAAGDITREPEDSDSDKLVVPPGTDVYRFHIDNEDYWNKSYCQKVSCVETSLDQQYYDFIVRKPITEYQWSSATYKTEPLWTRSSDCVDKAVELFGWRDHISFE